MFSNDMLMICVGVLASGDLRPALDAEMKLKDKAGALVLAAKAADMMLTQSWENYKSGPRTSGATVVNVMTPFSADHSVGYLLNGATVVSEIGNVIKSPALAQVRTTPVNRITDGVVLLTHFSEHIGLLAKRKFYEAMRERKAAGADLQISAMNQRIAESEADMSGFPVGAIWSNGDGDFYKTVQGGVMSHLGTSVETPQRVIDFAVESTIQSADLSSLVAQAPGSTLSQVTSEYRKQLNLELTRLLGRSVNVASIRPQRLPASDLAVLKRDAAVVVGSPAFIVDCIGTVIDEITVLGATDISRSAAIALTKRLGVSTLVVKSLPRSIVDFLANYANVRDYPFLRSIEAFYQQKAGYDVVTASADFWRSAEAGEMNRVHPVMLDYVAIQADGVTAIVTYGKDAKTATVKYLDPRLTGVNYKTADGGGATAVKRMHAVMDYVFSWICFPDDQTIAISVEHLRQLGVEGVNRKVGFAMT